MWIESFSCRVLAVATLGGVVTWGALVFAAAESTPEIPPGAPTPEQLASATFTGILEAPFVLENGVYEGAPYVEGGASRPRVHLESLRSYADLTGDGVAEAIVFVSSSSGGSGTYIYVALVGNEDGAARNLASARLGDRVQVRALHVREGRIEVDVVEQGAEDAACCPSQLARRSWEWDAGALRETQHQITGTLSLEVLNRTRWMLTQFDVDEPVPDGVEVTLEFEAERVGGSSGCNLYTTAVEGPATRQDVPSTLRFGPTAATRRLCEPHLNDAETLYLERLSQVRQFAFLMGHLALTWSEDGRYGTLLFDAR